MKIAVVGSRDYPRLDEVRNFVASLPPDTEIVSGGARGVDIVAEEEALLNGLLVKIFKPDWKKHGKSAGMVRNQEIADYCDFAIAFWDGKSPGTKWWENHPKTRNIWYSA